MIMIANLPILVDAVRQPRCRPALAGSCPTSRTAFTLFILFQTWGPARSTAWLIDRPREPRGFISARPASCAASAGRAWVTRPHAADALYGCYFTAPPAWARRFVYSGSIGSALKWFKEKRGLASGIIAAGFGGGTALFIPIISSTISVARLSDGVHRDRESFRV